MPATAPAAGGLVFGYVAGCATARVCGERRRDKRCSAGGRMPFASSQRFALERRLPRMRRTPA
ncbi:hypothetical protein BGI52_00965 [Burkholderia pseudomallei]|nr:hypothetical protein BGI49_00965 [Burkholderia pseudomallei]APZ11249.1 hypothetical protein BGI52_00965 [Burkholderia pseudomallei]